LQICKDTLLRIDYDKGNGLDHETVKILLTTDILIKTFKFKNKIGSEMSSHRERNIIESSKKCSKKISLNRLQNLL